MNIYIPFKPAPAWKRTHIEMAAENGFSSMNRVEKGNHCFTQMRTVVRFSLQFESAVDFLQIGWCERN